ncbi:MAG: O-antigen ligase C-terminal domain-containing protein [Kangiellaceae bacterium]|nr:O-antigen ligase C-terminal domain-containing protein [Kangiellaceae bacterium]
MQKYLSLNTLAILVIAALLLISPIYWQKSPGGFGLDLPINNLVWFFISILIALGFYKIHQNKFILANPIVKAASLFVLFLLLPLLYQSETNVDIYAGRVAGLIGLLLLLFSLTQFNFSSKDKRLLLILVIAYFVIETVIGLAQVYSAYTMMESLTRASEGSILQPNIQSIFMVAGFSLVYYLQANDDEKDLKRYNNNFYLIAYFLIFLFGLSFGFTGSRIGFLALVFSVIFWLLHIYINKNKRKHTVKFIIATFILLVGIVISYAIKQQTNSEEREVFSANQRVETYTVTLELIKENPLLGIGYGMYPKKVLDKYSAMVASDKLKVAKAIEKNITHPHNELLFWWVEGGIICLLAFIIFGVWYLLFIRETYAQSLPFLIFLIPFIFIGMTDIPYYSSATLVFIVIVFISCMSQNIRCNKVKFKAQIPFSFFTIIIAFSSSIFFFTNLHTIHQVRTYLTSSPTTTKYLNQIVNPLVWKNRIDFYQYAAHVDYGREQNRPQSCQPYTNWATQQLEHTYYRRYFYYLALAYDCTGQKKELKSILERMNYLYPGHDLFKKWLNDVEKTGKLNI